MRAFENRKRDALFELSVSKEPRPLDWSQESKEGESISRALSSIYRTIVADVSYGKCFPLEMHLGISPEERVEKFFQVKRKEHNLISIDIRLDFSQHSGYSRRCDNIRSRDASQHSAGNLHSNIRNFSWTKSSRERSWTSGKKSIN